MKHSRLLPLLPLRCGTDAPLPLLQHLESYDSDLESVAVAAYTWTLFLVALLIDAPLPRDCYGLPSDLGSEKDMVEVLDHRGYQRGSKLVR